MNYTRKVAYNTAAQFIGKIAGFAISLVTIAILFRFLGVEGLGKYTTVFAYVAFFTLFADLGLGWTLLRELSVSDDKEKVFRNIFTFRLVLGILVFSIGSIVVWLFHYPVDVKWAVAVLSAGFFLQSLNSTVINIYLNNYRMDIATSAEVVGKAVILLVVYLVSINAGSLSAIMLAYVLGSLVNLIITWGFASKFLKTGFAFDKVYWRYAFLQAFPIGVTLVFGYVYYKIDSLMLSMMKGMVDVGIYGAPYKLLEVLQMFPALFLGAAFSLITKYATEKDERIKPAFQKQYDFLVLLGAPVVVGVFVLAGPIISFVSGDNAAEFIHSSTISFGSVPITSVTCLKILIFSVGINYITTLYNFMIVSLGKQKEMVWPTIGFALFNVALNLALIPRFSYLGASIATLLTETLVLVAVHRITNRNLRLPLQFANFFKIIFAALIMGVIIYFFYNYLSDNILLTVAVAIVCYGLLALLLKIISKDILKSFFKPKGS